MNNEFILKTGTGLNEFVKELNELSISYNLIGYEIKEFNLSYPKWYFLMKCKENESSDNNMMRSLRNDLKDIQNIILDLQSSKIEE